MRVARNFVQIHRIHAFMPFCCTEEMKNDKIWWPLNWRKCSGNLFASTFLFRNRITFKHESSIHLCIIHTRVLLRYTKQIEIQNCFLVFNSDGKWTLCRPVERAFRKEHTKSKAYFWLCFSLKSHRLHCTLPNHSQKHKQKAYIYVNSMELPEFN